MSSFGYVEMHDRKETLSLLQGMELIETKEVKYKNMVLQELDVQAVIERNPDIVIIDEYAHTNPYSSKNEKRYQDIKEILEQGIDVYTTLNIQHIESLKELVRKVTKVKVKEIVPDKFITIADNVELIDIEPRELLSRLEEGKVYKKEQVKEAMENFFTMENLTKLREIALRYMTDSVDQKSIYEEVKENLLLILDGEENSLELINKTYEIASHLHCNWTVFLIGKKQQEKEEEEKQKIQELGGKIERQEHQFFLRKIQKSITKQEVSKVIISKRLVMKKKIRFYLLLKLKSMEFTSFYLL